MKEQRITVEIDQEGRITADSEGFGGETCLRELERLLEGLSPGTASVDRKPDVGRVHIAATRAQTVGRRP